MCLKDTGLKKVCYGKQRETQTLTVFLAQAKSDESRNDQQMAGSSSILHRRCKQLRGAVFTIF